MRKKRSLALTLITLSGLLLSTCATVRPSKIYLTRCPPLVEYDAAIRNRAADELMALGPDAALTGMIGDYGVLREQCRALQGPDV